METEGDNEPEATCDRLIVTLFEELRVCETEPVELGVCDIDPLELRVCDVDPL